MPCHLFPQHVADFHVSSERGSFLATQFLHFWLCNCQLSTLSFLGKNSRHSVYNSMHNLESLEFFRDATTLTSDSCTSNSEAKKTSSRTLLSPIVLCHFYVFEIPLTACHCRRWELLPLHCHLASQPQNDWIWSHSFRVYYITYLGSYIQLDPCTHSWNTLSFKLLATNFPKVDQQIPVSKLRFF